jgi:ribosomal-protein-alanine N-acetyltransferase
VIAVREGGPDDLDAVAALEESCLGVDAWSPGLVDQGLAGTLPTVHYLVAGDPVVGYAVVSVAGDIAELQRIGVDAAARRTGVASALLEQVVLLARRGGADRLLLEVREDNRGALAFYADRGFVEIDRRRRYYADGTTAVVMRLPVVKGCG